MWVHKTPPPQVSKACRRETASRATDTVVVSQDPVLNLSSSSSNSLSPPTRLPPTLTDALSSFPPSLLNTCLQHHNLYPSPSNNLSLFSPTTSSHSVIPSSPHPTIHITTWNINGLKPCHWPYISYLFCHFQWDVLLLVDTKLDLAAQQFAYQGLKKLTPEGTIITGSPTSTSSPQAQSDTNTHHGGLLWIISPLWSGAIKGPVYHDPSKEGVVSRITLSALNHNIHIIGTYFPMPTSSHSTDIKLSRRLEQFCHSTKTYRHCKSALDYLFHIIDQQSLRIHSDQDVTFLAGDLNYGPGGGTHQLTSWDSFRFWQNDPLDYCTSQSIPLYTKYKVTSPSSWIDHILYFNPSLQHPASDYSLDTPNRRRLTSITTIDSMIMPFFSDLFLQDLRTRSTRHPHKSSRPLSSFLLAS